MKFTNYEVLNSAWCGYRIDHPDMKAQRDWLLAQGYIELVERVTEKGREWAKEQEAESVNGGEDATQVDSRVAPDRPRDELVMDTHKRKTPLHQSRGPSGE